MIAGTQLRAIQPSDLQALCHEGYPESDDMEFKQDLCGADGPSTWRNEAKVSLDAKTDLLADIVALANTRGGHLLIGVKETADHPKRAQSLTPMPRATDLAERLRDICISCIDPIPHNLQLRAVPTDDQGNGVVIVRVGRSHDAPHRSTVDMEVYVRRGASTRKLDMREIQDLTLNLDRGNAALDKRLREFQTPFEHAVAVHVPAELLVKTCRLGLRVTAVPTRPFRLESTECQTLVQSARRQFKVGFRSGKSAEAQLPVMGFNPRPLVRGARISNRMTDALYEHSAYQDGAQSLIFVNYGQTAQPEHEYLYLDWVLGAAASVLYLADALAVASEESAVEFAVEVQVASQLSPPLLVIDYPTESLRLERSNLLLPRYPLVPERGKPAVLDAIRTDLLHSAGMFHQERIDKVE